MGIRVCTLGTSVHMYRGNTQMPWFLYIQVCGDMDSAEKFLRVSAEGPTVPAPRQTGTGKGAT